MSLDLDLYTQDRSARSAPFDAETFGRTFHHEIIRVDSGVCIHLVRGGEGQAACVVARLSTALARMAACYACISVNPISRSRLRCRRGCRGPPPAGAPADWRSRQPGRRRRDVRRPSLHFRVIRLFTFPLRFALLSKRARSLDKILRRRQALETTLSIPPHRLLNGVRQTVERCFFRQPNAQR